MFDDLFDGINDVDYDEAFPQDREYKQWMDQIEKDYASELASLDVDNDTNLVYSYDEVDEEADEDEDL